MRIEGLPVKDAKRKLHVLITDKDVADGARKDATCCAAALALMRHCGATEAKVHAARVYVKKDNKWMKFATPAALRSEIIAFDRGGSFEAGEYTLNPIPAAQTTEYRKQYASGLSRHKPNKNAKKRPKHKTVGIRERFKVHKTLD